MERARSWAGKLIWLLLTLAALAVGLFSLRYLLPHVPFPLTGFNMAQRRPWLVAHAASSSIAIMTGSWQFLRMTGSPRRTWHRWMGRLYLVAVLIGWLTSIPIALHAQTGTVASAGFLALGIAWIATSALAYLTIRQRNVQAHRRWMSRSYALTCAAITLRIMIPVAAMNGIPFPRSYPVIAWACWLLNLLLVELWMRNSSRPTRALPVGMA